MIGIFFFFLFLAAESYFVSLVKSHLFDITTEVLSIKRLQSDLYAEGICLYLGFFLTRKKVSSQAEQMTKSQITFEYITLQDHDRIQATAFVIPESEDRYTIEIQCTRNNQIITYRARIKIEHATFSLTEFSCSKKELFQ